MAKGWAPKTERTRGKGEGSRQLTLIFDVNEGGLPASGVFVGLDRRLSKELSRMLIHKDGSMPADTRVVGGW